MFRRLWQIKRRYVRHLSKPGSVVISLLELQVLSHLWTYAQLYRLNRCPRRGFTRFSFLLEICNNGHLLEEPLSRQSTRTKGGIESGSDALLTRKVNLCLASYLSSR